MSFHRKPSEFELEQTTFLGAKLSDAHEEFKEWAMMDCDEAFIIWLLENPNASLIDMLKVHAKLEWLKGKTELTLLSMVVGTESDNSNVKEEVERLRSAISNP